MSVISTSAADVWAALQVDLTEADGTEPVDKAYISTLIEGAESMVEGFIGKGLSSFDDGVPPLLTQAVITVVQARYRNRLSPEIPAEFWILIADHRVWGFG